MVEAFADVGEHGNGDEFGGIDDKGGDGKGEHAQVGDVGGGFFGEHGGGDVFR